MKKLIAVMLGVISMFTFNDLAADFDQAKREKVEFIQHGSLKDTALKGAAGGAALFSAMIHQPLLYSEEERKSFKPSSLGLSVGGGAMLGAVINTIMVASSRGFTRWRINRILKAYTPYIFQKLPLNQALLVYSAYLGKRDLMDQARQLPRVAAFEQEPDVKKALSELYERATSPDIVARFKEQLPEWARR